MAGQKFFALFNVKFHGKLFTCRVLIIFYAGYIIKLYFSSPYLQIGGLFFTDSGNIYNLIQASLHFPSIWFVSDWLKLNKTCLLVNTNPRATWALTNHERLRIRLQLEAIVAVMYGLDADDFRWLLKDCDYPVDVVTELAYSQFDPKGFWRVDKDKPPEHRLTVLSLVAFHDLQKKIEACGGDREKGIEAFCSQNGGEGWMLPETLRLADYGLGHDERAKEHQPVRECFGPRFHPWQLEQSPEEFWRECHLHARNLLGPARYQALLDELEGKTDAKKPAERQEKLPDGYLFDTSNTPLFDELP